MTSPKIDTIDYASPDEAKVARAASILSQGGLVVAPTETRYGLLARADRPEILSKLYHVKGRPVSLPTAVFVKDVEGISEFGEVNAAVRRLAEKFLPGPLTLVVKAVVETGEPLVVDGKIGIRISSAPFIQNLLRAVDFPVTATSANPTGDDDLDTVEEIARVFGGKIELYLDVGVLDNPVSTVVDVSGDVPKVLREAAVAENEILEVLKSQLI